MEHSVGVFSFYLRRRKKCKSNESIITLDHKIDTSANEIKSGSFSEILKQFKMKNISDKLVESDTIIQKNFNLEYIEELGYDQSSHECIVLKGKYGRSGANVSLENSDEGTIQSLTDKDKLLRDMYIFVIIPKSVDNNIEKGIIFFHEYSDYGVQKLTQDTLKIFFKQFNISILYSCLSPSELVNTIINDKAIHKITLIKNQGSDDICDNIELGYGKETRIYEGLNVNDAYKKKLINYAKSSNTTFETIGECFDEVKVTVKIGGKDRIFNLKNIDTQRYTEIIEEVEDVDGILNPNKLIVKIKELTDDYLGRLVLTVDEKIYKVQ